MIIETILMKTLGKTIGGFLTKVLTNKYFWIALALFAIFFLGYNLATKNAKITSLEEQVEQLQAQVDKKDEQVGDERESCETIIEGDQEIEEKYEQALEDIRLLKHCPKIKPEVIEACPDESGVLRHTTTGRPIEEVVNEINIHGSDEFVTSKLCEFSLLEERLCQQ